MIKGIGIDIVEIDRIKKAMTQDRFLTRNFSKEEQALFEARKYRPETVAANFAMKEAVVKALGTGFRALNVRDVNILRDPLGKPVIAMSQALALAMDAAGADEIMLSCSHSQAYAVGQALIQAKHPVID